jgi:hypothetical protein
VVGGARAPRDFEKSRKEIKRGAASLLDPYLSSLGFLGCTQIIDAEYSSTPKQLMFIG